MIKRKVNDIKRGLINMVDEIKTALFSIGCVFLLLGALEVLVASARCSSYSQFASSDAFAALLPETCFISMCGLIGVCAGIAALWLQLQKLLERPEPPPVVQTAPLDSLGRLLAPGGSPQADKTLAFMASARC